MYSRRAFLDRGARLGAGIAGGLSLAALLDACGPGSGSISPTPPPGATVIRALLFDQVGYDPTLLQKLANRFRSLHDDKVFVSIETAHYRELYESILAAGLSKPAPYDVVALDQVWVPEFASRKQLLSLTDQIPDDARSDLMPSLLDAFSYKGINWAMPHVLNVQSLYYNKNQLKSAGFNTPPKTLEDWHAQMTALRSRLTPYTDSWAQDEGLVSDFVRITAEFGGDLFDVNGKPLLQGQPALRAAAFMRQLIDEHLVRAEIAASNEPDAMRAFLSGGVAFTTNWNFVWGAMNDPAYSQIIGQGAVAPVPAAGATGKPAASVSGFLGLGVLSNSAHADLAVAWLRYLTSPEVQGQQTGELPMWTSLQNSSAFRKANPQIDVFLTNLANAQPRPKLVHYVEASSVLQRHLHDLVLGTATPSAAMSDAQSELLALQARFGS
ncbi:MAG TPA: extracellular solute-binding protein [Candidatus Angelobacter sp.]|jgi:multiple sugar transport system substrate-binding protein|nr:extracellular solute-binding protein [Candidatus Angelobacter sp.]